MILELASLIITIIIIILGSFFILLPHIGVKISKKIGYMMGIVILLLAFALIGIHIYNYTETTKEFIIVSVSNVIYLAILFVIDTIGNKRSISKYIVFPITVAISLMLVYFIGAYYLDYKYYNTTVSIIIFNTFYFENVEQKEKKRSKVNFPIYCIIVFFILKGLFQGFLGDIDKLNKQTKLTKEYITQEMKIDKSNIIRITPTGGNRYDKKRILVSVMKKDKKVFYEFNYYNGTLKLENVIK